MIDPFEKTLSPFVGRKGSLARLVVGSNKCEKGGREGERGMERENIGGGGNIITYALKA